MRFNHLLVLGILVSLTLLASATSLPSVGIDLVYPEGNQTVNQNLFFHVTTNVSCLGPGDCGNIDVSLDPLPDQCTNYTSVNWDQFSVYSPYSTCGCTNSLTPGWYRMTGTYHAIPTQQSYTPYVCDTHAPGFLDYSYPTGLGETTTGNICYHWSGSTCEWTSYSEITMCPGYYVYYLTPSPGCCMHPCTTDLVPDPIVEKTGLVSTNPGDLPFYTSGSNPQAISLNSGQSGLVTFLVNATTLPWNFSFFAYANLSSYPSVSDRTGNWTVGVVPAPGVSFVDLPPFIKASGQTEEVLINISADNFLGAPDSVTLERVWWNNGTKNLTYSGPVTKTFARGTYALTAYAQDTSGKVYSNPANLTISNVACGDYVDSDITLYADLDCTGYSGPALEADSSGITIDCDGHTISGNDNYDGIVIDEYDGVTVKDCVLVGFDDGIYSDNSDRGTFTRNTFVEDYYGIDLYYSDDNEIMNNKFINNSVGFYLYHADNNQIGRNTLTNINDANFGSGSCPFLFLWDGANYSYYTDLAGESLGSPWFETPLYGAGIYELGDFKPDGGEYRMKLREVIPESDFVDEMKLAIVDAPEGYGVLNSWHNTYSDNVVPPKDFMTIRDPREPISATDKYGKDVLDAVSGKDGVPLGMEGSEPNSVVLDFGPIDNPQFAKLIITGWSSYESNPDMASLKNLRIETIDAEGNWVVSRKFGKFSGDSRTYVFDISNAVKANDTRMRITAPYSKTVINVLDQVLLDDSAPVNFTVTYVDPASAELGWGGSTGYSYATARHRHIVSNEQLPDNDDYLMYGNYTKYGSVLPLLGSADDEFAIMRHGDALDLSFQDIPEKTGMDRHVFLLADVMYSIKYSVQGYVSDSINPIPFHGMSQYPYWTNESYPDDAAHRAYRNEWNTREYAKPQIAGGSLPYSYNNTVFDNTFVGGPYSTGLYLDNEESTSILNNVMSDVEVGIELYHSTDTTISGNTISANGGRGIQMFYYSDYNFVARNNILSNNSEECYYPDGCGGIYASGSEGNQITDNDVQAIRGFGVFLDSDEPQEIQESEVSDGYDPTLVLHNSLQGDTWIIDYSGYGIYNDSASGNRYYADDGTPAAEMFDINDTDNDGWADEGDDLPFACYTVGHCEEAAAEVMEATALRRPAYWLGYGEDWHPFVAEPEHNDEETREESLSLGIDSSCDGAIVTVTAGGDPVEGATVAVDGSRVGTTDSGGNVEFGSSCGGSVRVHSTYSGYLPGDKTFDLIPCGECGEQNVTPGCTVDADCLASQRCHSGECAPVPCECGQIANHQCTPFACCSDSQCAADELCENHACKKKPQYECTTDAQCAGSDYCDIPVGAAGGSCKPVTGQCGSVRNHAFVAFGYECGTEPGCPSCPEGSSCTSHACISNNDLSCPSTGIVGDKKTCEAKENSVPCANCDYVVTDPAGKNSTGRTDENGNFDLPLNMQGTYKVALMKDGAVVKIIEVKAFPQAQPEEPAKPVASGPDLGMVTALLALLLLIVLGIAYWRSRGKSKQKK
jgi:parallel beta-helix repeat protein